MPSYKLTYFDIKARAEPIRLAFAIAGVPFEDERISRDQWAALKPTLAFGQVPALTVDNNTVIAQSSAIIRFVGKLGNGSLYPVADAFKSARVDQIMGQLMDIEAAMRPSGVEPDQEKKLAMRKELAEKTFPKLLGDLDRFIGSNKWAAGDSITIADLLIYQANTSYSSGAYDGLPKTLLEPYPNIQRVVAGVKSHPAVAKWEADHQK